MRGSDLVVLATPVIPILDLIERLGPALPARTLVTDVGSTKAEIVARAAKSFGRTAGQRFLAGHPMAGKEHAGVEFADADLFEGAAWLFTPLPAPEPARRPLRRIRPLRGENGRTRRRRSIPPNTTASAPGSAICRR